MQMVQEGYQMTLDDLGIWSGKMCREPSQAENQKEQILRESSKKSVVYGECWTLNTGESPSVAVESFLWQILEDSPPQRYYLSQKACRGILERVKARGKKLPEQLLWALKKQAGIEG